MQENVSILETIVADMPDMFYSEILPKLGLFETLNLAKVSKKYRDLVWSLEGARSFPAKVEAHFAKVNVLAGKGEAMAAEAGSFADAAALLREKGEGGGYLSRLFR